jgi:formyl-CoA transferase
MRTMIAMGAKWGTQSAERRGNGANPVVNLFPCKPGGPNDYVYIMCVTDKMWQSLCKAIERDDLANDERLKTNIGRRDHVDLIFEEISKWTRQRTKQEAMKYLADRDVPSSAIFDTKDLYTDPHLVGRGFVKEVDHEELGTIPLLGWPARMSESEVPMQAAPVLGRHTLEVLKHDLGLTDEELQNFVESKIVSHGEPNARKAKAD